MDEDSKDGNENLEVSVPPICKEPPTLISFEQSDLDANKVEGSLFMGSDGKFHFEGDLDVSAKLLFERLKQHLDNYIAEKLKNIEKAKELCRKYAKATKFYENIIELDFVEMSPNAKKLVNQAGQEILDILDNGTEQAAENSTESPDGN